MVGDELPTEPMAPWMVPSFCWYSCRLALTFSVKSVYLSESSLIRLSTLSPVSEISFDDSDPGIAEDASPKAASTFFATMSSATQADDCARLSRSPATMFIPSMRFSKLLCRHANIRSEPWLTFGHHPTAHPAHPPDPTHALHRAVTRDSTPGR